MYCKVLQNKLFSEIKMTYQPVVLSRDLHVTAELLYLHPCIHENIIYRLRYHHLFHKLLCVQSVCPLAVSCCSPDRCSIRNNRAAGKIHCPESHLSSPCPACIRIIPAG